MAHPAQVERGFVNRRSFLRILGSGIVAPVAIAPVRKYFFAPIGGWNQKHWIRLTNASAFYDGATVDFYSQEGGLSNKATISYVDTLTNTIWFNYAISVQVGDYILLPPKHHEMNGGIYYSDGSGVLDVVTA